MQSPAATSFRFRSVIILSALLTSFILMTGYSAEVKAQTTIFEEDFNTSQGTDYTTTGSIGSSDWLISRSADDWGGRIHNGILELTNTASTTANANGWVFAYQDEATNFDPSYNPVLTDNSSPISWTFNMRQIRDNPAGFGSGNYGGAFILATNNSSPATTGDGYAVVLGNTGTPDPLRLVSFNDTEGIQGIGATSSGIIIATTPLDNPTDNYMSIEVVYDPADNSWEMFGRDDGTSAFADPQTGSLTSLGTAIDNTHTGKSLNFTGAYWQGATAADQTAFFDNITVSQSTQSDDFTISPGSLSGFTYHETEGPAASESFTVSSTSLTPADAEVSIAAPPAFEVSLDNTIFFNAVSVNATSGAINETVYVRLRAGLQEGSYSAQLLSINSANAEEATLELSGIVNPPNITSLLAYPINPISGQTDGDLSATLNASNISSTDLAISEDNIGFGDAQESEWTGLGGDLPYAQGTSNWDATSAGTAKNFFFTITPDAGFAVTINRIEFHERATGAGPSALSILVNDEVIETLNVPDSQTRAQSIEIDGFANQESAVIIKIAGWDNGSRSTTGGGDFRINDIRVYGTVRDGSEVFTQQVTGSEGWRFVSSPVANASYADMFSEIWTQGMPGANDERTTVDPNVLTLNSTGAYVAVPDLDVNFSPGSGAAVYVFEDSDPTDTNADKTFPKTLSVTGFENAGNIEVSGLNSGAADQFSIVGNPFNSSIVFNGLNTTNIGEVVYVYDTAFDANTEGDGADSGSFRAWNGLAGSLQGGIIAPFQSFLVYTEDTSTPTLSIPESAKTTESGSFYRAFDDPPVLQLVSRLNDALVSDTWLSFSEPGSITPNKYDATVLYPLDYAAFLSMYAENAGNALNIKNLPLEFEGAISLPLHLDAWQPDENGGYQPAGGEVELSWPVMDHIPDDWTITLTDNFTGDSVDLMESDRYAFSMEVGKQERRLEHQLAIQSPEISDKNAARFTITVDPDIATSAPPAHELPQNLSLSQNYPNPFNPATQISYELPESAEVRLEVFNIQGQRVATLVDATQAAGSHSVRFDAGNLSSGVYLYRLQYGNSLLSRKMTLVK